MKEKQVEISGFNSVGSSEELSGTAMATKPHSDRKMLLGTMMSVRGKRH